MTPILHTLTSDLERVMFTPEELEAMLCRVGGEITKSYAESIAERRLVVIGVLKGSFIFMADLIRHIDLPLEVLFLQASSYGSGTESCGRVQINMELDKKLVAGKDVLFVEDILDSGRTLQKLAQYFSDAGAHSVKICTMLDKPARRVVPVSTDFCGFKVEDEFLVGYGLDYNELYRNLPYVAVLKREIYSK